MNLWIDLVLVSSQTIKGKKTYQLYKSWIQIIVKKIRFKIFLKVNQEQKVSSLSYVCIHKILHVTMYFIYVQYSNISSQEIQHINSNKQQCFKTSLVIVTLGNQRKSMFAHIFCKLLIQKGKGQMTMTWTLM